MSFNRGQGKRKASAALEEQFELVFRQYFVRLCCFANRYTQNTEESKELVQEVFLNAWNKREYLHFGDDIHFYLFRAVKNTCLNQLQHQRVVSEYQEVLYLLYGRDEEGSSPFHQLELDELQSEINQALADLPVECRRIFLLSRDQGMKYAEIARELSISVKTVETQMGRALAKLRLALAEYL